MEKNLLIVFAKNKLFGKVKTRLAKTIGDQAAFEVYNRLFEITETESSAVRNAVVEVHYSHHLDNDSWKNFNRFVQEGENLGDRMKNAFEKGFERGYENVIGIGADLPEITSGIIEDAFSKLLDNDFVFGPAEDGGYYLVGVKKSKGLYVFENKPWSTPSLLDITKKQIQEKKETFYTLKALNDIDTIDDLKASSIANEFRLLFQ